MPKQVNSSINLLNFKTLPILKVNYFLLIVMALVALMVAVPAGFALSTTDGLDYQIIGGEVLYFITNPNENSIIFKINSTSDGQLTVTIPKSVLDARLGDEPRDFFVFVDDKKVSFVEKASSIERTLSIPFPHGTQGIEIIGTLMGTSTNSDATISVYTDKSTYGKNESIKISGKVSEITSGNFVSLQVTQPDGKTVAIDQVKVLDDKTFSGIFWIGDLYETSGIYTIKATYGMQSPATAKTTFDYVKSNAVQPENKNDLLDDGDGIPIHLDKCPSYKEDFNGYQDDDGCPDVPRIKTPFEKEILNGDEYIPYRYSFDFTKKPLIGISFDNKNNEELQRVVDSVKKGVEMWTIPLEQKFGGDWSVDFVIMSDENRNRVEPDIVFNIQAVQSGSDCKAQAWTANYEEYDSDMRIYKAKTPINIHHCYLQNTIEDPELFSWLSQKSYEPTNAHEFFHALGFMHTYNKRLDFMCGASEEVSCPQGNPIEEQFKKKIISDFDLTAIAYLYGVDGFENPNKPIVVQSKFTAKDYLDFDASTYEIILAPTQLKSQPSTKIPSWVQNTMKWYLDGLTSEDEMISAIQFLVNQKIIKLD